ncbi:MAG TPA: S-methyl-5-thioribose-1-phosphate isomerase [Acidimicrobiia bacterium]|nr:S-methyl-5-thioribose-1-phosphate isomerase [Acidimicrobiia bacterium]
MGFEEDPIPRTVEWRDGAVRLIDQRRLPGRLAFIDCRTVAELCEAISSLAVRGAPALGAAGGYGIALACRLAVVGGSGGGRGDPAPPAGGWGDPAPAAAGRPAPAAAVARAAGEAARQLVATRPTAVNLAWGVRQVLATVEAAVAAGSTAEDVGRVALEEADRLAEQDVTDNRALGRHGSGLVPHGARVLTHCNAGALACVGYGTALGVIRAAAEAGKAPRVWVDETRPVLQGARLTAWELDRLGIAATLVADVMAGSLMASGDVDLVVVGADRVAANGDVANKIGTYSLAVLAAHHGVPFYVAAPTSTVDLATPTGAAIPVEERSPDEVRRVGGATLAPEGFAALNRAFDVTPAELVTAIVTELGLARPPYGKSLRRLVEAAPHRLPLRDR